MSKKKLWKKNTGGGFALPIRRRYEREALEAKGKHKDRAEIRPTDRPTTKEVMELTPRTPEEIERIRATMAMPLDQRIARAEAFIAECDREIAQRELRNDAARLSKAEALNERAEELMQERSIGYVEAVRLASQEKESAEPTPEQVEAYAAEHEMDFGTALRSMLRDQRTEAQAFGVGGVDIEQENRELERALKDRGYQLD